MKLALGTAREVITDSLVPPTIDVAVDQEKKTLTVQATFQIPDNPVDAERLGRTDDNKGKVVSVLHLIGSGKAIPLTVNGQSLLDEEKNQIKFNCRVFSVTQMGPEGSESTADEEE